MTAVEDRAAATPVDGGNGKGSKQSRLKPRDKYNKHEAVAGYLFDAPWVVGFLVFTLGAMVYILVILFSDYDLATDTAIPNDGAN